ncbi:MAG TPA: BON domain-containing protein [Caulobacteraceae bacterium]|nr:BON domain-containing protein [Caulobacteraceae bacterium]
MADNERWGDRDRNWRNRSWQQGDGQSRGGAWSPDREGQGFYGSGPGASGSGGSFGPGGRGNRGYSSQGQGGGYGGRDAEERWRQMHSDRSHEGPAGYNDSGPIQGGWEFGDEAQGGEPGQGYDRYGYGYGQDQRYAQQTYGERGRDPGVGSGQGETWGSDREFGRGGGYGAGTTGSGQRWRGGQGGGYRAGGQQRSQSSIGGGQSDYAYGAHTPYGYRGRNEYDNRGRGGEHAEGGEHRSWMERAGERVADFFGAGEHGSSHRGRGPKGYRRSDARIQEDISDRLTDDPWLDASNIEVEVKECEVILKGEVTSREDKRRAEDLAEAISGVRNVQNHLRVQDQSTGMGQSSAAGTGSAMGVSGVLHDQASGRDRDSDNGKDRKGRPHAPDSAPGLNT